MTDVESASIPREGSRALRMQVPNSANRRGRTPCLPRRRSILALSIIPLLVVFIVVLNLYWQLNFDSFPYVNIIRPADARQDLSFGIILRPEDHAGRTSTTQRLSWTITKSLLSPDGVQKRVFQINGQFPGPTIEARSGDMLEVEVINLSGENVSMHWHGLHMIGANEMDGPIGITQCAIPSGKRFLYKVPIGDQAGTFWYHAHSEAHRADGLYGGLIVHDPGSPLPPTHAGIEYDKEVLLMIGDWYHPQSADVLSKFMSYKSEGFEPCPDSLLINGMGKFECSNAVPAQPVSCIDIQAPYLQLDKRLKYRLRVVNVGSMTGITLTTPDATLQVITVDGGLPVEAHLASSVGVLYPAERVDMILTFDQTVADEDSLLRIGLDNEYFMEPNHALEPVQWFSVSSKRPHDLSPSNDSDASTFLSLQGLKGAKQSTTLPDPDHKFMIWSVVEVLDHNHGIPQGVVNRTSWQPQSIPLLALPRDEWDGNQLVPWTGPSSAWVELTINNIDGTGHPFHLHGHDFYVVATHGGNGGWDYYNPFNDVEPRGGPFNVIDPLQKDTVYVPAYGYVVLRFHADHEGIWALHCHIMWHQASGMSMAFQVLGNEMQALSDSAGAIGAKKNCEAWK